ncbi:MAG: hypothetical protein AABX55_02690 [Nanoarchaeota archaeon]
MENYIFILGRNPELSLLEIISYLDKKDIKFKILDRWANILVLEIDKEKFDINELGGIIKIAKVEIKSNDKNVTKNYVNNLDFDKNKIFYTSNDILINSYLKERFKELGIKAHYKKFTFDPKFANLDLEIIKFKDCIARVTQISNPKQYKKRDQVRPYFDEKKVISIRLARILINISKAKKEILDPFCGLGTILQEALLLNLDAYGLDLKIKEAEKNLSWLNKNFKINNKYKLYQGDARNLSKFFNKVECCVTEPYMGPFLKNYPNEQQVRNILQELVPLYLRVFKELDKIIEKRVVIILPVFKSNNKNTFRIKINELIANTKFKIADSPYIKLPLIYKHKKSIIEREIWILDKQ